MRPEPIACGLAKIATNCCSVTWQTDLHLHCREWDELRSVCEESSKLGTSRNKNKN